MKNRIIFAVLLVVILCTATTLHAQREARKTKVGYIPIVNIAKQPVYEGVCGAVTETLELSLSLVPSFAVSRIREIDPYRQLDRLSRIADDEGLDYVVFGSAAPGKSASIVLRMSVYSRAKRTVTVTNDRTSPNFFGVFNTGAQLVALTVEAFSGLTIGFGSLEATNVGEEGDYELFIDGESAGRNFTSSRKVFNGVRRVEVVQRRMFGEEVIFSQNVEVAAGKEARFQFAVPYLLDREREAVERLEGDIESAADRRELREEVLRLFAELSGLFSDTSYCRRLEQYGEDVRQREVMYRLKAVTWEIEDGVFDPKKETIDALGEIYQERTSCPDPQAVEDGVTMNCGFLFSVLDLNASRQIALGDWESAVETYDHMESVVDMVRLQNTGGFVEDKRFVDRIWKRYAKKSAKSETFAEIMIGVRMAKRFKDKIQGAQRFFKAIDDIREKELVVFTFPPGVEVALEGAETGASPLRLVELEGESVRLSVSSPWYSDARSTVALRGERTVAYLPSEMLHTLVVYQVKYGDRKDPTLSWSDVPGTKEYRVQVDTADGDFTKPVLNLKGIRKSSTVIQRNLKKGTSYVFRVMAVGGDGIESGWVYGEQFEAR